MKFLARTQNKFYSTYIRYIFVSFSVQIQDDFHEKEVSYEKFYLFQNLS